MIKRMISVLLTVMMVMSVATISAINFNAVEIEKESNKIYFDAQKTGWEVTAKSKISFYIYSLENGEEDTIAWGSKKLNGTAVNDADGNFTGVFSYDPAAKGMNLKEGEQYAIIFTFGSTQTYDLMMDTTCLGNIAYADPENQIENPFDSSKTAIPAYWEDLDAAKYGPRLQITSTGNVVGSSLPAGETGENIFTTFLTATGQQGIENARLYSTKTEQQMIDDIGTALGLNKDFVKSAFKENSVTTTWSYETSTLPGEVIPVHIHTPGESVQENVVPATCKFEGTYDEVIYCTECGEEISRVAKTIDKLDHTPGEAVQENVVPATCKAEGFYDVVVYCTECGEQISRETKTIDKLAHTPGESVIENIIPATCKFEGTYDEVVYCTECGEEISRETKTIDKLAHTPGEAVKENEVPATCKAEGSYDVVVYCTECGEEISRETKTIDKFEHTPGEPVQENVVPATCEEEGSYDEVIYCSECGEEISREDVTIKAEGHKLHLVEEVPATATKDGMKAHYACDNCDKLFADADGTVEVTADDLHIPLVEMKIGDINKDYEITVMDATYIQFYLSYQRSLNGGEYEPVEIGSRDFTVADVDGDGRISIFDALRIQRYCAKMCKLDGSPYDD